MCGNAVVGSTAPISSFNGKFEINEPDFLFSNGISECEGAVVLVQAGAVEQMFGVAGNFEGFLVTVDQDDASGKLVGDLTTQGGITGMAIDSKGKLFVTTNPRFNPGRVDDRSFLLEVNPLTGVVINSVGPMEKLIRDLAFQPGTDVLFANAGRSLGPPR